MTYKDLEVIAFNEGSVEKWAEVKASSGDILPPDHATLQLVFHNERARCKIVPVPLRLASRDILKSSGMDATPETMPITVMEQLSIMGAKNLLSVNIPKLLQGDGGYKEIVLLFPNEYLRDRIYMTMAQDLKNEVDKNKSRVSTREYYTKKGVHVKFALPHDNYEVPQGRVAYKVINDVFA